MFSESREFDGFFPAVFPERRRADFGASKECSAAILGQNSRHASGSGMKLTVRKNAVFRGNSDSLEKPGFRYCFNFKTLVVTGATFVAYLFSAAIKANFRRSAA